MKMPIYVKIDQYKEVEDALSQIKAKVNEAKLTLKKINDLRDQEVKDLTEKESRIREIEEKIEVVKSSMES